MSNKLFHYKLWRIWWRDKSCPLRLSWSHLKGFKKKHFRRRSCYNQNFFEREAHFYRGIMTINIQLFIACKLLIWMVFRAAIAQGSGSPLWKVFFFVWELLKKLVECFFHLHSFQGFHSYVLFSYRIAPILHYIQVVQNRNFESAAFSIQRLQTCTFNFKRQLLAFLDKRNDLFGNTIRHLTGYACKEIGAYGLRYEILSCSVWRQERWTFKSLLVRTDRAKLFCHIYLQVLWKWSAYIFKCVRRSRKSSFS